MRPGGGVAHSDSDRGEGMPFDTFVAYRDFDDLFQTRVGLLENFAYVLADLVRLLGHGAFDEVAFRISGYLSCHPDLAIGSECLRLE